LTSPFVEIKNSDCEGIVNKAILTALLLLISISHSAQSADQKNISKEQLFFQNKVQPILVGKCLECHGSEKKGDLDLRTRKTALKGGESGAAFTLGQPGESLLIDYVDSQEMPPKNPLSKGEVALLKKWIQTGAYFPDQPLNFFSTTTDKRAGTDWWSLQPLAKVTLPEGNSLPPQWRENPIDRFVFQQLRKENMQPAKAATPRKLLRRVTYNLTGLPPTPQELKSFLTACQQETGSADTVGNQAYAALVDRLLASPRYGEQWGRHWLDVIRFGESRGFERNEIINNAWPFRDYIINSFNADKPFNQLVLEHLAGDQIAPGNPDVEVGVTFLVCGPYDDVGNKDKAQAAQIRANTIDEIIRATGETFLGMTIGCSRCHNHKFDPITQQYYYSLYSTFAGVKHGSRIVASKKQISQHATELKLLQDAQQQIKTEKSKLEAIILARGNKQSKQYAALWKRPAVNQYLTEDTFTPVRAKYVRLQVEAGENASIQHGRYNIDEFEVWTAGNQSRNVALAINGASATGKSRVAEDFADAYGAQLTIDGKFGARWNATGSELIITFAKPEAIHRILFSSDRKKTLGKHRKTTFIGEYRLAVSLDGKAWTEVASSYNRKPLTEGHRRKRILKKETTPEEQKLFVQLNTQLAAVTRKIAAVKPLNNWWVGTYNQPAEAMHIFLRGDPQRTGDAVLPHSLSALKTVNPAYELKKDSAEGTRRYQLARWLVADQNPLTPRVLVNRIWHYHFGTGIVDTPSDFGFMGGKPTHPELLDWLAGYLQQEGWKMKPLHRLIVMSRTYRQSTQYNKLYARQDANSRYLWRFPPRRLSAEEIRDTMLQISGKLNSNMGGAGFRLYKYLQDNVATYVPLNTHGVETYRRSVYHQNARATRIDLMTEFDSPDCAFSTPRRATTTTPLQALTMLNHSFTLDMSKSLAHKLQQQTKNNVSAEVNHAYILCYTRAPSEAEMKLATHFIKQHGLRAFCRALLNSNELIYLY